MVGRSVLLRVEKKPATPTDPLLTVRDLHVNDTRGLEAVRGLSMEVRSGEIVGIAGVDGNGQTELVEALTGLVSPTSGVIEIGGKDVAGGGAEASFEAGMGHIPEDRQRFGLVLDFTLAENLALREFHSPPESTVGFLWPRRMARRARTLLEEFDVRGGEPQTPARSLSGGNQQKVVIAREVSGDRRVLVASQPTRGLDVGAIEFVHRRLVEERDKGRAILLVSFELEEILSLSDRILVMYEGRIAAEHPPTVSEAQLGIDMTGGRRAATA
jgi:simple sugar transport system ATP-binding protein